MMYKTNIMILTCANCGKKLGIAELNPAVKMKGEIGDNYPPLKKINFNDRVCDHRSFSFFCSTECGYENYKKMMIDD